MNVPIRTVRRAGRSAWKAEADICVLGAGISGISAALEAAALGRKVLLADGLPALGGQAVNSIIGTFCGLFSNGPKRFQLTHGIADGILRDLGAKGALYHNVGPMTTVVYYEEVALARWIEQKVREAGITVVLGAVLRNCSLENRRITELELATRYGDVRLKATGFVDASGDAALTYTAGLACREPDVPLYGTQMVVLEGIDEAHVPKRDAFDKRLREKADQYGLGRKQGVVFYSPGRGTAVMNLTHVETPLEPFAASRNALVGRDEADKVVAFMRAEYPEVFAKAKVRSYGLPGIRQTRWIVSAHHLSVDEVRRGTHFPDAVARTSWPIELHDRLEGYVWETFGDEHIHTVPLRSMLPADCDNLVAAGRCIDGDAAALSSVRVMGPCIAMGAAAAHALDLAGSGSLHQLDIAALRERLRDNIGHEHAHAA
ncbi:MAG: FAD-dependent oxidoreductase [Betaproteobacteria bacterium]